MKSNTSLAQRLAYDRVSFPCITVDIRTLPVRQRMVWVLLQRWDRAALCGEFRRVFLEASLSLVECQLQEMTRLSDRAVNAMRLVVRTTLPFGLRWEMLQPSDWTEVVAMAVHVIHATSRVSKARALGWIATGESAPSVLSPRILAAADLLIDRFDGQAMDSITSQALSAGLRVAYHEQTGIDLSLAGSMEWATCEVLRMALSLTTVLAEQGGAPLPISLLEPLMTEADIEAAGLDADDALCAGEWVTVINLVLLALSSTVYVDASRAWEYASRELELGFVPQSSHDLGVI